MATTSVPKYERANVPELNSNILTQVKSNFDDSWSFEKQKQPNLSAVRKDYPEQVRADLKLGGQLRADTQDQVVGSALNQASNSGVVDSFSGRGLVAQDIGTTAETLRASRMDRAANLLQNEPLEYLGLTSGQIGSIYVDDKVRDFQNRKDQAQASQAETAQKVAAGLALASKF
jgi:hypothetical protein